ncbi:hypothetical protein BOO69_18535 [Sulfitobacter alexandrii]|uniref:Glutathione S-transferase family protein n=1 Tax=Sulfitobacter alexandrii TaxID=1917485 RepID=A0A1J0WLZ9_9RHOB|nr:glutathione S-transferase family protein [Sulfitobacter alexandrii]APE45192.1 hypothetical protein BOO69_18535 [Sulfitobacter alexandrii]
MLTLYYSRGSSALAAHILLIEVGAAFDTVEVSIAGGRHRTPEFTALNPKGRIPALGTPEGILTENPAILEYIAATHPHAGLIPGSPYDQARARSLCAYICATVHVAFAHGKRADRWADDPAARDAMRTKVRENLLDCADLLERHLLEGPWALGPRFGYCDPYLFLVGRWMKAHDLTLASFPRMEAHSRLMLERPATKTAMQAHLPG